jgi:hypothetical protein
MNKKAEDIVNFSQAIDRNYQKLLYLVKAVRAGEDEKLKEIANILNESLLISEEYQDFSLFVQYLASLDRELFITFLFKTHRAHLVLLIDPRAIAVALKVQKVLDFEQDSDGKIVIKHFLEPKNRPLFNPTVQQLFDRASNGARGRGGYKMRPQRPPMLHDDCAQLIRGFEEVKPDPTPSEAANKNRKSIPEPGPETTVPKAEAPKAEAPKAEAPKAEASKAEAPKAEAERDSPEETKKLWSNLRDDDDDKPKKMVNKKTRGT